MKSQPNFTFPGAGNTITLPTGRAFVVLACVVSVGIITCVAMIFAALILAAYLLDLAVSAVCELFTHLASVYAGADSFSKILIWLLLSFILIKILPLIARSVRGSFLLTR